MSVNNESVSEEISPKTYFNASYEPAMLDAFSKMRLGQESNFTLEVGDESIYVHKEVLATASPYFAAMLQHDLKEKAEGKVTFTNVEPTVMKAIVDYLYSGEITITEDNITALFFASDFLQMEWIKGKCESFLKDAVKLTNCFNMRDFADKHSNKNLFDYCHNYILKHFARLINSEELLTLTFEEFKAIITADDLYVQFEENAYQAVLNWVKYNQEGRQIHFGELMSHIRLPLLETEFLKNHVLAEPLVKNNQLRKELVLNGEIKREDSSNNLESPKKNKKRYGVLHVIFTGGFSNADNGDRKYSDNEEDDTAADNTEESDMEIGEKHSSCKLYDVYNDKGFTISSMKEDRISHSTVFFKGFVYSMGGRDKRTAERYDPITNQWTHIASMHNDRHYYGACVCNDLIYAVGGNNNTTVENYDPITDKWYNCPDTPAPYGANNGVAVIENSIYSLGCGGNGKMLHNRFDPREAQWCNLNNNIIGIEWFDVASRGYSLYCIGGYDAERQCQRFEARSNKWQKLSDLNVGGHEHKALNMEDGIYVFIGKESILESYDIEENSWTIEEEMDFEHWDGGAASIYHLRNWYKKVWTPGVAC
ncbi:kelch-like protein 3 [Glossina fuscipes]|uniref:Kelch-like protein diablo n=1 Tax=Glossina fuscipes TaxID=7396 RepID=A0A9C5ZAN4_9MUSC|nr:kelch-like protein 3 [Glossina fuscipes]